MGWGVQGRWEVQEERGLLHRARNGVKGRGQCRRGPRTAWNGQRNPRSEPCVLIRAELGRELVLMIWVAAEPVLFLKDICLAGGWANTKRERPMARNAWEGLGDTNTASTPPHSLLICCSTSVTESQAEYWPPISTVHRTDQELAPLSPTHTSIHGTTPLPAPRLSTTWQLITIYYPEGKDGPALHASLGLLEGIGAFTWYKYSCKFLVSAPIPVSLQR